MGLPTAKFIRWETWDGGRWCPCGTVSIEGVETPPQIMEFQHQLEETVRSHCQDGRLSIPCMNLAGIEAKPFEVDIESDRVVNIRKGQCKLVMPDGRVLTDSDDQTPIRSILSGFAD